MSSKKASEPIVVASVKEKLRRRGITLTQASQIDSWVKEMKPHRLASEDLVSIITAENLPESIHSCLEQWIRTTCYCLAVIDQLSEQILYLEKQRVDGDTGKPGRVLN